MVGVEEAPINYTSFVGNTVWNGDHRFVKMTASSGIWTSISQHASNMNQICEVEKGLYYFSFISWTKH